MSTSGIANKQVPDKNNVGGKKFTSVNISSVHTGKSLVQQKSSAPSKHGLQSLGKTTAVARRMPPPANLPSLKSECAGQDPDVALVPAGAPGWGSNSNQNSQQPDGQTAAGQQQVFADGKQSKVPNQADATQLAQAAASAGATNTTGSNARPSWSNRTGSSSTLPTSAAPATQSSAPPGSSSAAANYFASIANLEFPKLSTESEKMSSGPSLRPQKAGGWKSGALNATSSRDDDTPPSGGIADRNGAGTDSISSSPTPHLQHGAGGPGMPPQLPPHGALFQPSMIVGPYPGSHRQGPQPPPHMFSVPPPGAPPHPYGMPPPPPHVMMRHPVPYSTGPQFYGGGPYPPHASQQTGQNRDRYGQPLAPPYDERGPPPPQPYYGGPPPQPPSHYHRQQPDDVSGGAGDYDDYDSTIPSQANDTPPAVLQRPPPPPRGQQPPSRYPDQPPPHYERDWQRGGGSYGGGGRDSVGHRDQHGRPMVHYEGVWSDDESNAREDDHYYDRRSSANMEKQAVSDTDERYDHHRPPPAATAANSGGGDFDRRRPTRQMGPPPPIHPYQQQQHYNHPSYRHGGGGGYGPYYGSNDRRQQAPPQHMEDRYHHGPSPNMYPPQAAAGRYDSRLAMSQSMGAPPANYRSGHDPRDFDAEEEEERARQLEQQYAREAAIEQSNRKRMMAAQKTSASSVSSEPHRDEYYPVEKPDRFNRSAESYSEPTDSGDYRYEKPVHDQYTRVSYQSTVVSQKAEKTKLFASIPDEEDENKFEVLQKSTRVAKRTAPGKSTSQKEPAKPSPSKSQTGGDTMPKQSPTQMPQKITIAKSERQIAEAAKKAKESEETLQQLSDQKMAHSDPKSGSELSSTEEKPNVWEKRKEQQQSQVKETGSSSSMPSRQMSIDENKAPGLDQIGDTASMARFRKFEDVQHQQSNDVRMQLRGNDPKGGDVEHVAPLYEHTDSYNMPSRDDGVSGRRSGGDRAASTSGRGRRNREFVSSRHLRGSSHPVGLTRRGGGGGWAREDYGGSGYNSRSNANYDFDPSSTQQEPRRRRHGGGGGETGDGRRRQQREPKEKEPTKQPSLDEAKNEKADREKSDSSVKAPLENAAEVEVTEKEKEPSQKIDTKSTSRRQGENSSSRAERGRSHNRRGGGRSSRHVDEYRRFEVENYGNFDPNEHDYNREHRGSGQRLLRGSGGGGGSMSSRRGGVPPRFSSNRQNNGHRFLEGDYEPERQDYSRSGNDGRRRPTTTSKSGSARRPVSSTAKSPPLGGGRSEGVGVANVQSSEGHEEWATASESSDVGEAPQNTKPRSNEENHEKRRSVSQRHQKNVPSDNSDNTRSYNNGQMGGGSSRRPASGQRGSGTSNRRPPRNPGGTGSKGAAFHDENTKPSSTIGNFTNDVNGPKNSQVASHQRHPGQEEQQNDQSGTKASTGPRRSAPNSNARTQHLPAPRAQKLTPSTATSNRQQSLEERSGSTAAQQALQRKSDVLATVNLNDIAGVHVIDNQPDTVSVTDSQGEFKQVLSRKEQRRNKKEQQVELERKSQSPGKLSKTKIDQHVSERSVAKPTKFPTNVTPSLKRGATSIVEEPQPLMNGLVPNPENTWNPNTANIVQNGTLLETPQSNDPNEHLSSKTGVEIWGTPDPIPFTRVESSSSDTAATTGNADPNISSKCVVRPTKHVEEGLPSKPVEFVADAFSNVNEHYGVHIDFTFDSSDLQMPTFDGSSDTRDPTGQYQNQTRGGGQVQQQANTNVQQSPVEHAEQQQHQNASSNHQPALTSPSTDQLSEKIASVKKVWDSLHNALIGDDNLSNGSCGNIASSQGGLMIVEDSFYNNASCGGATQEIQSTLNATNVYSMAHALMNQSNEQQSNIGGGHSDQLMKSSPTQAPIIPSSKSSAEGPNVAKVRPQQQQPARQPSVEAIPFSPAVSSSQGMSSLRCAPGIFAAQAKFDLAEPLPSMMASTGGGNFQQQHQQLPPSTTSFVGNIFLQPTGTSLQNAAAMYGSIGQSPAGNFIFQNPYQINGVPATSGGVGKALPPQSLDLFNSAGGVARPYVYHPHQPIPSPQTAGPPPSLVLAAAPQSLPIDNSTPYRHSAGGAGSGAAANGGIGEMFASFVSQRPPPPTNGGGFMGGPKTPATGGPFLLSSDNVVGNGLSLFTQPPPALSRTTPCQPGMFAFAPPQPQTGAQHPPAFGQRGGANFGGKTMNAVAANVAAPAPYGNWSNTQPKLFNPTIGPPTAHHAKLAYNSAGGAALFNLSNLTPGAGAAFGTVPSLASLKKSAGGILNVLAAATATPGCGGTGSLGNAIKFINSNAENYRRGGGGGDDDSTKRDGDLLQQIDDFINATSGGDDEAAAAANHGGLTSHDAVAIVSVGDAIVSANEN